MKRAVLFLHGRYRQQDFEFYRRLCRGAFTIAVDAGYRFFRRTGIAPDLLAGDFDSLKKIPGDLPDKTAVKQVDVRKDQTDAEIALEYAVIHGFSHIDIVQPSHGESDHFLANVMLLQLVPALASGRSMPEVRIVSPRDEIILVEDGEMTISKATGDGLSVIPLSNDVKYSCSGTDYDVEGITLRVGQTRGLRNRIMKSRATFRVTGKALLIHRFGR